MSNIQLRGHCQACGREQAVRNGRMAHHGYEVKYRGQGGYFNGACGGHNYRPIEVDRGHADAVVKSSREAALGLRVLAAQYADGSVKPSEVPSGRLVRPNGPASKPVEEMIPWDEAPAHLQVQEVNRLRVRADRRAQFLEDFANRLEWLADRVHGQPLQEVVKAEGPEPILIGEKRELRGRIVVAQSVSRGMVSWKGEGGSKGWGCMSSRSWRLLPKVEGWAFRGYWIKG